MAFKKLKILILMLVCSLLLSMPAFAKNTEMTAKYDKASHKYLIDFEDELFSISNLEDGEEYKSTVLFKNTTGKLLTISLIDVENLLDDARLYDLSKIRFTSSKTLYDGVMNDARFSFTLLPEEERLITITYHIDAFPHRPDNSIMNAKMHTRFHFVGVFDTYKNSHVIGEGANIKETIGPTVPETTAPSETTPVNSEKPTITVTIPKTGDDFPLYGMLGIFLISIAGLIIFRRNQKISILSQKPH